MNLLSDAAQSQTWPTGRAFDHQGQDALLLAWLLHRFQGADEGHRPPRMSTLSLSRRRAPAAPSARSSRRAAVSTRASPSGRDVTGKALEKAVAIGVGIGSGYMYETTFEKEVYSDLYGERGVLMGGIRECRNLFTMRNLLNFVHAEGHVPGPIQGPPAPTGIARLRHSTRPSRRRPSRSSLSSANTGKYILPKAGRESDENVHAAWDYMYNACSTTARRGALDWATYLRESQPPRVREAL